MASWRTAAAARSDEMFPSSRRESTARAKLRPPAGQVESDQHLADQLGARRFGRVGWCTQDGLERRAPRLP